MTTALEAAAARGIKIVPSDDPEFPYSAIVPGPRGRGFPLVHLLATTPEIAAAEALAYVGARRRTSPEQLKRLITPGRAP